MFRILLFLLMFGVVEAVGAQPVIDIGQGGDAAEADLAVTEGQQEEKKGFFSFMNFDFWNKSTVEENKTEDDSFEALLKKADEGDLDSQILVGYLYLYGEQGVERDYKKALKYYTKAAEQNDKIAVNNLGSLYYSGIGTKRDSRKAAELFQKASDLGNSEASVNLAFIYLTGMGMTPNYQKAVELFGVAADEGNPTAKFMLGYSYYKGFIVKKDLRYAFSLIRDAASVSKYDGAQYVLAKMYENGEGVTKNYGNAIKLLAESAKQGNVDAIMDLGGILAEGKIYAKNPIEAHIWYNIASVYNIPTAAEKRDALEKNMRIEDLLNAQAAAGTFEEKPSEVTTYIRGTFGYDIYRYIDEAMKPAKKI